MGIQFDNSNRKWYCECSKGPLNIYMLHVDVTTRGTIYVTCPYCKDTRMVGYED